MPVPVPDRSHRTPILAAIALALSCARPATEPAPQPAEPPPVSPTPSAASPEPVFDTAPSPEVLAYLADCSHVIEVPDDVEGNPVSECDAVPFDQNCAHDPSGCWDAGRGCEHACSSPCDRCQATCADTCDTCKAECPAGSEGCLRACAETRAACRTTCMREWDACLAACPDKERACNAAFEAQVAERCPDCEEIGDCLMEHEEYWEERPACTRQFPRVDEVCFEWCYPS